MTQYRRHSRSTAATRHSCLGAIRAMMARSSASTAATSAEPLRALQSASAAIVLAVSCGRPSPTDLADVFDRTRINPSEFRL